MRLEQSNTNISEYCRKNEDKDKICDKRILIYIPTITGKIDCLFIHGFIHFLCDCWEHKKEGWQFFPIFGRGMFIQNARNLAVDHAIENNMDYILFLDDDMVIPEDAKLFTKLLSHNKDIVAPLFFHRVQPCAPLIFKRVIRANGRYTTFDNILDYPKGLIEVDGVGFGCVLIKVDVFKKLSKPYFLHGDTFGEDLFFSNKCIEAGIKIYSDTNLVLGHIGDPMVTTEDTFIANRASTELFMRQKTAKDEVDSKKLIKEVDIVMPCYHNYKITKEAVESIINNTTDVNFNLILINDGGDKNLEKYFKTLEKYNDNITHVTDKNNIGFVKSVNQGIALSNRPYVLVINNDIRVPESQPDWLARMVWATEGDSVGAVGCVSNFVMGIQNIDYNKTILLQEHYTKFLIGFCILIKKEVIEKVGLLDEAFGIGGNDDLDYSIRIRKAGYKLKVLRSVFIDHKGFQSLGMIYKDYKKVEDITRPILIAKWGKEEVDNLFSYSAETLTKG